MTRDRRMNLFLAAGVALFAALLPGCSDPAEDAPAPWTDGLLAGLHEIERHSLAERHDEALEVGTRMVEPDAYARFRADLDRWTGGALERALQPVADALDWIGIDALSSRDLGEIEFARATAQVARARGLEAEERKAALFAAEASFERARAAGHGVRADAVCGLGVLDLEEGEAVRATLPEISGVQPAPAAPGAQPDEKDDGPEPLEIARKRYEAAKDHFVEVLRMAPAPEEGERRAEVEALTRAGVELCIRRLRELDQIEQQREEQQNQDQEQDQQQPQDGDPNGDRQDGEDGEPQENEPSEQEEPSESEQQEGEPEEEQSDGSEDEAPAEQEIEEREMTKEELERFLEEARENREEGEERRRILLKKRKVPTQRDW